ncbi:MAG: TonB-dependent receptor [Prolixibacteraceae bacterium]|nr:TonB-dependent receptor [Prolixibacteraceae bacterium]
MRRTLFFTLFIINYITQAQPLPQKTIPLVKGVIRGKIIDAETKQYMEYANVSVYNQNDSALVTGGITNDNGEFEISKLSFGNYYIDANFIGFDKTRVPNILIDAGTPEVDLGTIQLKPSTQKIGAVDVIAEKARVEYKVDKKVINVGQDINATGGTAVDVLENTPSVQVDIEGNVTLRGSGNFTVLIDGRPTILTGSDALQQIPASAIDNIEIITNPSVKYDPDGMAGIINLVMKKNVLSGFNGIVNASVGTGDKQSLGLLVNQTTKKRNISFGVDLSNRSFSGEQTSSRETLLNDTTTFLNKDGSRGFSRGGYNFKAGTDFFLNELTTLGFSANYGHYQFESGGTSNIHQYFLPPAENRYSVEDDFSERGGDYASGNIDFLRKFNEEGTHKLNATFYYSHEKGSDQDNENEFISDASFNPTDVYSLRIRTNEDETEDEFRLKADYTKPLGDFGKLEAGLQSRIDRETEDYLFERYNTETHTWENNELYSSSMTFKRDIHSAYSTVSSKIGPLEYMLGVRGEYTNRRIGHTKVNTPYTINRLDFFPSAHFSYTFFDDNQLMASYSRRIDRPNGRDLDPFKSYRDQYTIQSGNPNLKPEYTNSYELSYLKRLGKSFISLESFYRVTNNLISRLSELGDDGIIYETTVNLNNDFSMGGELMANVNLAEWLLVNSSISVYKYKIEDSSNSEEVVTRESTNVNGRINSTLKFSQNSRMQLTGMYRGPSVSIQGENKGIFYSNISYRHDLFNKKLTATVSLQDIFGTAVSKGTASGTNFSSAYKFKREPQILMFTLSYRINNYKTENSGQSENGEMDFGEGSF